jgi:hypothetical protein
MSFVHSESEFPKSEREVERQADEGGNGRSAFVRSYGFTWRVESLGNETRIDSMSSSTVPLRPNERDEIDMLRLRMRRWLGKVKLPKWRDVR